MPISERLKKAYYGNAQPITREQLRAAERQAHTTVLHQAAWVLVKLGAGDLAEAVIAIAEKEEQASA